VAIGVTLDGCDLNLGPSRDGSGAYVVTGSGACELGNPPIGMLQTISGTARFDGLSCPKGTPPYCYAGTFEFHLTSVLTNPLTPSGGESMPFLTGQPFHVTGTFCPFSDTVPSCGG
jgi:hypothetical protein